MKATFKITILAIMALSVFIGCGDDKKGNNNGGYYNPYNNPYGNYNNGINQGYPQPPYTSPETVILRGPIQIKNRTAYEEYLRGIGVCGKVLGINSCPWVSTSWNGYNQPVVTVIVDDYLLRTPQKSSFGTVAIMTPTGEANYRVEYRAINADSAIEGQTLGPTATRSFNKFLVVRLTGKTTDHTIPTELFYNGKLFGTASVYRQNRE